MTWKPTEEMRKILRENLDAGTSEEDAYFALIAVQPLIAAEARAMALEEAANEVKSFSLLTGEDACIIIRSLIPKPPDTA